MMSEREKLTEQAEDILDKWEFFYGQRAGRELWAEKTEKVQNADIEAFCRDLAVVRSAVTDNNVGSNWIPVTMRRPDLELVEARAEDFDLFPCLVVNTSPLTPRKRYVTKAWYDGVGFMDTDCVRITPTVTHWSPLPELPKEGT